MIPAVCVVIGIALVSAGLWASPAPWLALIWIGCAVGAVGLLYDFEEGR